jgi:hypothetical protein
LAFFAYIISKEINMLTSNDYEVIKNAWRAGLTKASFGAGKGTCDINGTRDGSIVLYCCRDKIQLENDHKAGTPYLFSHSGYKGLKASMDALGPAEIPEKSVGKIVIRKKTVEKEVEVKAQ